MPHQLLPPPPHSPRISVHTGALSDRSLTKDAYAFWSIYSKECQTLHNIITVNGYTYFLEKHVHILYAVIKILKDLITLPYILIILKYLNSWPLYIH